MSNISRQHQTAAAIPVSPDSPGSPFSISANLLRLFSHIKYENLAAGLSGGVISTMVLHPLDLVKIRFAGNALFIRMTCAAQRCVYADSWLLQSASATRFLGDLHLIFALRENSRRDIPPSNVSAHTQMPCSHNRCNELPLVFRLQLSWLSFLFRFLVPVPLPLHSPPPLCCLVVSDGLQMRPQYDGMVHCMRSIWQLEGIRGLYQGVTPNIWGAGASWGLYFLLWVCAWERMDGFALFVYLLVSFVCVHARQGWTYMLKQPKTISVQGLKSPG